MHQWKLRSNPAYLRRCCWKRDHGVCAICGVDAGSKQEAAAWVRSWFSNWYRYQDFLRAVGWLADERAGFWQADHIVPVAEGGGECGLDNIRTLCRRCHVAETAALRSRLARKAGGA